MFLEFTGILVFISKIIIIQATLYEGDFCTIKNLPGVCTNRDSCPKLEEAFKQGKIRNEEIPRCGFATNKEIICCPTQDLEGETDKFCFNNNFQSEIDENDDLELNIYNGVRVQKNEYGFMAALGYKNSKDQFMFVCGGTLIDKKFILTAAHCVDDPRKRLSVVMLGSVTLNYVITSVTIGIKNFHIHSDFRSSSTYNDVALIELEVGVRFTNSIYPICLYTKTFDPPVNSKLYAAGWGRTEKSSSSPWLLKAELNIIPLETCRNYMENMGPQRRLALGVQNSLICANGSEQDTCEGDSGGPLLMKTNQNEYYLIGVVAAGFGCGGPMPGLYTRVSSYMDFIKNKVGPYNV